MTVSQAELDQISAAGGLRLRAVAYDDGTVGEIFANARITRLLQNSGHFRPNYARTVVQSVHDRLEIENLTILPTGSHERVMVEWDDNDLDSLLDDVLRDTLVGGDHYVIVWPGKEEGTVDVVAHSSENVRVWYDPSSPRYPIRAVKVWWEDDRWRVTEWDSQTMNRWAGPVGAKELRAEHLVPYQEGEGDQVTVPAVEANPFGEPPVVHFRTRRPYGRPEHRDAWGPQDAINKLVASHMGTVDYQAFPQRWALNTVGQDGATGTLWDDDDDPTTPEGDKERARYKADPAEVWWMDATKVGQFDVADPDAFLKPLQFQIESMATTTQTPLFHLVSGPQSPSGEERRASESPLMAKVRRRQRVFEHSVRQVVRLLCKALNTDFESVSVRWADPARLDDKSKWDTALAKQAAGVPRRQALLEAGYDEETVDEWEKAGLLKQALPPAQPPPNQPIPGTQPQEKEPTNG